MSIISTIFGLYCIYLGEYRDLDDLGYTDIHVNAFTLMSIMLIYGKTAFLNFLSILIDFLIYRLPSICSLFYLPNFVKFLFARLCS